MGGRGSSSGIGGKGSRTVKPLFRKNTAKETEKLFNQQSALVREIQSLERGMPIAIAKAKTAVEKMEIRRKYNKEIEEKRKKANAISKKLYGG